MHAWIINVRCDEHKSLKPIAVFTLTRAVDSDHYAVDVQRKVRVQGTWKLRNPAYDDELIEVSHLDENDEFVLPESIEVGDGGKHFVSDLIIASDQRTHYQFGCPVPTCKLNASANRARLAERIGKYAEYATDGVQTISLRSLCTLLSY